MILSLPMPSVQVKQFTESVEPIKTERLSNTGNTEHGDTARLAGG